MAQVNLTSQINRAVGKAVGNRQMGELFNHFGLTDTLGMGVGDGIPQATKLTAELRDSGIPEAEWMRLLLEKTHEVLWRRNPHEADAFRLQHADLFDILESKGVRVLWVTLATLHPSACTDIRDAETALVGMPQNKRSKVAQAVEPFLQDDRVIESLYSHAGYGNTPRPAGLSQGAHISRLRKLLVRDDVQVSIESVFLFKTLGEVQEVAEQFTTANVKLVVALHDAGFPLPDHVLQALEHAPAPFQITEEMKEVRDLAEDEFDEHSLRQVIRVLGLPQTAMESADVPLAVINIFRTLYAKNPGAYPHALLSQFSGAVFKLLANTPNRARAFRRSHRRFVQFAINHGLDMCETFVAVHNMASAGEEVEPHVHQGVPQPTPPPRQGQPAPVQPHVHQAVSQPTPPPHKGQPAGGLDLSVLDGVDFNEMERRAANGTLPKPEKVMNKDVFIVHGHDKPMKDQVKAFLYDLDLKPIALVDEPRGGSKTIIEHFLNHSEGAACAIVLLSPDDVGGIADAGLTQERARQNVIFELGFFMGKLDLNRVLLLKKGKVEIPSDLHGILYVSMDGEWRWELRRELKAMGMPVKD